MFKAFDTQTATDVIILDRLAEDQLVVLRQRGRDGILLCPSCKRVVIVKAGEIVRHHFAHKHISPDCPVGNDSADLLQARAVLYHWLKSKFPSGVTIEKQIDGLALPRPLDCWVETSKGRKFAYLIIDRNMKPMQRDSFTSGIRAVGAHLQVIFLSKMLRRDQSRPNVVELQTTERGFLSKTDYDALHVEKGHHHLEAGTSIHYLDAKAESVTSFRHMQCVFWPKAHKGVEKTLPLKDILVSPTTGEFVLPGEWARLEAFRAEQVRLKAQREAEERERLAAAQRRMRTPPMRQMVPRQRPTIVPAVRKPVQALPPLPPLPPPPQEAVTFENKEGRCVLCGNLTREWWFFDGATATCKCNDCRRKGVTSSQ